VSKVDLQLTCPKCGGAVEQAAGRGRPRRFCSPRCKESSRPVVTRSRVPYGKKASNCSRCGEVCWRRATSAADILCRSCRGPRRVHGLTAGELSALRDDHNGRCAICQREAELCVDHDHACCSGTYSCGKCVRGLLCRSCNSGIGMFGDDPAALRRAIRYLERGG
jgi:hypothetical protein